MQTICTVAFSVISSRLTPLLGKFEKLENSTLLLRNTFLKSIHQNVLDNDKFIKSIVNLKVMDNEYSTELINQLS